MKIILQKFIAESGSCSRRRAEELIRQGKVTVNGKKAELGMKADENDEVRINGKRVILAKEKIYIILNKPKGYVSTNRKFAGEKNVLELLSVGTGLDLSLQHGLIIAGRLDKESRGLVFLTNDGDLVMKLTHPRYGYYKKYLAQIALNREIVNVRNKPADKRIAADKERMAANHEYIINVFKRGVDIGEEDGVVRAKGAKYLGEGKFEIILGEGKKRQIRRMFRALGLSVEDLVRTSIGPIRLGNLPEGKWRHLTEMEVRSLR